MPEMNNGIKIEDLGYDAFFESNRRKLKLDDFPVARVISEYKESYKVKDSNEEYLAKITGKRIFNASSREDYPVVGDWVAITKLGDNRAVVEEILPRRTIIKRKSIGKNEIQAIAMNIDVAFIVESIDRDFNLNRFERYFSLANDGGIKPAIILNKIDLASKEDLDSKLSRIKERFPDIDFISASIMDNKGLEELKSYIEKGKTYCFLGSSGVGKSSLINKLLGKNVIKTEEISAYSNRGKHVTTSREMYFLETGGIVIDNPGMREVGMTDAGAGIDSFFEGITALAKRCKYSDCKHIHEPGCEVLAALKSGRISEDQYSNYVNLKKEAEYYEMNKLEKREKDRQFGKFIKKTKESLRNHGHKSF